MLARISARGASVKGLTSSAKWNRALMCDSRADRASSRGLRTARTTSSTAPRAASSPRPAAAAAARRLPRFTNRPTASAAQRSRIWGRAQRAATSPRSLIFTPWEWNNAVRCPKSTGMSSELLSRATSWSTARVRRTWARARYSPCAPAASAVARASHCGQLSARNSGRNRGAPGWCPAGAPGAGIAGRRAGTSVGSSRTMAL
mmetsp:Transcript_91903/g.210515  ORF Transcript_91903/g.210515 Transcript_91903/m.210515 type:complete len:203 (+) Transcript_91903:172-780(+)